jgi:hypothetical protein
MKQKRKLNFLKVTTTSIYAFEEGEINGQPTEEVIQDWFEEFPMDQFHATRDTSKLGGSTLVQKVEVISEKEFDKYVEEFQKKKER